MKKARFVAVCGLLTAAAFVLNWLEFMLPLSLPVPGFKLGLSNIITLLALYKLGAIPAFAILVVRCTLSSILFGGATQFLFSIMGGVFALTAMSTAKKVNVFSPYGVSIAGAAAHNIGQTTSAVILMKTVSLYSYLIFLLPLGIVTGMLTAFIFKLCERVKI